MEFWLDTIDIHFIKQVIENGRLDGVTTNPGILSKSEILPEKKLAAILDISELKNLAVQVVATKFEDIVKQAKDLYALDSKRIIIKIPVNVSGLKAIHALTCEGIPVMATGIVEPEQVYFSALAGAKYAAVYFSKVADDPLKMIDTMCKIIHQTGFATRILAASVKNKSQFISCAISGVAAITINAQLYSELMQSHPLTENSIRVFLEDWLSSHNASKSQLMKLS